MRILRITSLGYESGGAENGIVLANAELARLGHVVTVLASDAGPRGVARFSDRTFPALLDQPMLLKPLYGCFYPPVYRAVRQAVREEAPDIAHVHTTSQLSPAVFLALRGVPTVLTIHGAEDFTYSLLRWGFPDTFFHADRGLNLTGMLHYGYHRFVNGPLYRAMLSRYVTTAVSLSRAMQRLLREDGIETVYVPNMAKLLVPAPFDPVSRNILYVGRLEMSKGVQHLIDACAEVRVPGVTLTIVGTGSAAGELATYAQKLPQGTVQFVGHRTREELPAYYRAGAVCVVPSVWPEPFGKVGIEAMSAGRPVIASNVGGISEWLQDGETGYLVPPADPRALAERLTLLMEDGALRRAMGDRAARAAQAFSIEAHAARMVELYEATIARHVRAVRAAPGGTR